MATTKDSQDRLVKGFYESVDRNGAYSTGDNATQHPFAGTLTEFVDKWDLKYKKCLEVGSGKGLFQDVVSDYTGIDIASNLSVYYHKPFFAVKDARLPFGDGSFDAIFSYATYEHIPDIETALRELLRVMKPGAVCLLAPAWHTRPWFAEGYAVRTFSSLTPRQRFVKATIPLRDSPLIRYPFVMLRRLARLGGYLLTGARPSSLKYKKLKANYDSFWQSDSDACNSLDPFDVILWFRARGVVCHGYMDLARCLLVRVHALELQKPFL